MPPKGSGRISLRVTEAAEAAAATNTPKQSKVVILKLSASALSKYPSDSIPKASSSSSPSSAKNSPPPPDVNDETSAAGTPAPGAAPERKKPGPPKGVKRKAQEALLPDGTPKPRGKPGPKKRKLDGVEAPWTTPAVGAGAHKLGPKANQGAINAGLRALDRTGKPCRKWTKKPITLRSFTGQVWIMPTWGAPQRPKAEEAGESSATGTPEASGAAAGDDKENLVAGAAEKSALGTPAPSSDAGRGTPGPDNGINGQRRESQAGTPVPTTA